MRAKNLRKNQCGAILVFGMAFLLLVFGIGALIVDILRIERAARSLQRAADAAALAGASQFNRNIGELKSLYDPDFAVESWKNSKRIAILALRLNPIFGDDGEIINSPLNNHPGGAQDLFYDNGGNYSYTDYDFQSLHVKIERVFYYRQVSGCPAIPGERPLDGLENCSSDGSSPACVPLQCCVRPLGVQVASPRVSNGIRVTLTLKNLPLIFGRFVGLRKLATLTRTALGAPSIPVVGASDEFCP